MQTSKPRSASSRCACRALSVSTTSWPSSRSARRAPSESSPRRRRAESIRAWWSSPAARDAWCAAALVETFAPLAIARGHRVPDRRVETLENRVTMAARVQLQTVPSQPDLPWRAPRRRPPPQMPADTQSGRRLRRRSMAGQRPFDRGLGGAQHGRLAESGERCLRRSEIRIELGDERIGGDEFPKEVAAIEAA